jgi:hypothetical protein
MNAKVHWERIYDTLTPTEPSWYQKYARLSLELIQSTGLSKSAQIIDIGGGTSTLVDELLREGYQHITVPDGAGTALELAEKLSVSCEKNWCRNYQGFWSPSL